MASRIPNRYFDMKGNEYDYDYFNHCFATFGNLVSKVNKRIPGGIEGEFIKHLLKEKKYHQGGWMVKPDGSKIRLYYPIQLYQLLLLRDSSGQYVKTNGELTWKPKALEYYKTWKYNIKQHEEAEEERRHQAFLNNIARFDTDINKD